MSYKVIAYSFPFFCSLYLKFLCPVVSLLSDMLGNSPGKNPIESPLSILKSEMQQKTIKNKRQLIEELISAWRREDSVRNACNEMVHSMPADVAARNNAKAHLPNTKRTLCFILMRFVLFLSLYGFYIKENRLNTSRKPRKQFL